MKRPFFLAVMALVLGEVCGRYTKKELAFCWNIFFVFVVMILTFQGILWIRWKTKEKKQTKKRVQKRKRQCRLLSFSFFILFFCSGCCHNLFFQKIMIVPDGMEDGIEVTMIGQVIEKERVDEGFHYRLKNPLVLFRKEGKETKEIHTLTGDVKLYGIKKEVVLKQKVMVKGKLKQLELASNQGQFNQKQYYLSKGIVCSVTKGVIEKQWGRGSVLFENIWKFRERLNTVYEESMEKRQAGVLMAMITGEKGSLDEEVKKMYQEQGIAHILAISGLHVAFVGRGIFRQLRKRGIGYILSGGGAMVLLIGYCIMVGKSASVFRACVMLLLLLTGEMIGRSYDMLTAMALSALFLVLENPYCLNDAGFLLSYGAIIGIGIYAPLLKECFKKGEGGSSLKESVIVSGSVQLVTLPVLLHTFFGYSPYSIFLNLFIIPMMGVLLPIGIFGGFVGLFSLLWAKILLVPACLILQFYELTCKGMERIPSSFVITGEVGFQFYIPYFIMMTVGFLLLKRKKKKQWVCLLVVSISICLWEPKGSLSIICADVGQGDGILFQMPTKRYYLLDGGSSSIQDVGKYRLLPLLHYYGVTTLEGAIVTHLDADHYNGMEQLFGEVKIEKLFLPKLLEKEEAYEALEKKAKSYGTKIYYMAKGDEIREGEVEFQWISPDRIEQEEDKNDNSQVFYLSYKQFSALFTGDMGKEREEKLLEDIRHCTLLKVGHHGSKNSSIEPFIQKINPDYGVFSYGKKNRYGHPNNEVVERLQRYGATIYKTGEDGAIFFQTDGKTLRIKKYLNS